MGGTETSRSARWEPPKNKKRRKESRFMKLVKIISIICVLALALTLVSSFAFAAAPEAEVSVDAGDNARANKHYVVKKTGTYMYNNASTGSGYKFPSPIPVGDHVVRVDQSVYNITFYKVMYGSYTGYVLKSHLTEVQ